MGLVISGLCCLGNCACCVACRSCCCCGASSDKKATANNGRCGSLTIMLMTVGFSLLCQYVLGNYFEYYAFEDGCGDSHACMGAAAVYRISFVSAIFFFTLAIIGKLEPGLHDEFWGLKFWAWILGIVVVWFIPNPVFFGYIWPARIGAFLFVILQQILLIDLAYYVNDTLVAAADEGTSDELCGLAMPLVLLLFMSFLCFAIAIAGIALLFVYFGTQCESPNLILSLTIVFLCIAIPCQLFISKDSNLLTSSFVSVYAVYLAAASLSANPIERCNPFYSNSSDWLSILLGISFTVLVLMYTIWSASTNAKYLKDGRAEQNNGPGGNLMNKILTGQLESGDSENPTSSETVSPENVSNQEEDLPKSSAEVSSFCIVMGLMAMNVAMILTNWGSTHRGGGQASSPSSGKVAMFVIAASQWTCLLLFIWTLVAPTLFPDRDFS